MSEQVTLRDEEVSAKHLHKKKLLKEEEERKKKQVVVERWLELQVDSHNKKGGKLKMCRRMKSGNVYRHMIGFEKQVEVKELMQRAKKKGLELIRV